RLRTVALASIEDSSTELFLSAVSSWEIAIKYRLGRLRLPSAPAVYIPQQMRLNAIQPLHILVEHTLAVADLLLHHRDPFDRLLVAQAQLENLPIISDDSHIRRYGVQTVW